MITVKGLYKEYDNVIAVNHADLEIPDGEVVGLVGPNGAGKTTLLKMLGSVLPPTEGTASIDNRDIIKDQVEIHRITGYMPDFFNFYNDLKVRECLDFFAEAHGKPADKRKARIEYVLEIVGLKEKYNEFIKGLSRGMIQRLGLARAMLHDPRTYLLDEPMSGIDPRGRAELKEALKKLQSEGKTVVISSHVLAELSDFCTSLIIMEKGKISASGKLNEIEKKISAKKVLHLEVISDEKEAESCLRQDERIEVLDRKGKIFTLSFDGDQAGIADLNEKLVKKGVKIISLADKITLEDIYLKISGGVGK